MYTIYDKVLQYIDKSMPLLWRITEVQQKLHMLIDLSIYFTQNYIDLIITRMRYVMYHVFKWHIKNKC